MFRSNENKTCPLVRMPENLDEEAKKSIGTAIHKINELTKQSIMNGGGRLSPIKARVLAKCLSLAIIGGITAGGVVGVMYILQNAEWFKQVNGIVLCGNNILVRGLSNVNQVFGYDTCSVKELKLDLIIQKVSLPITGVTGIISGMNQKKIEDIIYEYIVSEVKVDGEGNIRTCDQYGGMKRHRGSRTKRCRSHTKRHHKSRAKQRGGSRTKHRRGSRKKHRRGFRTGRKSKSRTRR